MKSVLFGISLLTVYTQAALSSTCEGADLVINIPYPSSFGANLLKLQAGNCTETIMQGRGDFFYNTTSAHAEIKIPIDGCNLRTELYSIPVTTRTGGLYRPTASVTFGQRINDVDLVFRHMDIAAECGMRTSYKVEFNYQNISAKSVCELPMVEIDGICVYPSYTDDVVLEIDEYTSGTFLETAVEANRATLAGTPIYLSMRQVTMTDGYKFAVTNCSIITPENNRFVLINPGSRHGVCGMRDLGLSASYSNFNFNFQHLLFLFNVRENVEFSSFKLECNAEICAKTVSNSTCNVAAAKCMTTDEEKMSYMCDGHCDLSSYVCQIQNDLPVCVEKTCRCENGNAAVGSECPNEGDAFCSSCDVNHDLESGSCNYSSPSVAESFTCSSGLYTSQVFINNLRTMYPKNCVNNPNTNPVDTSIFRNIRQYATAPMGNPHYFYVWYVETIASYTWAEGQALCREHGLEMAEIHSFTEDILFNAHVCSDSGGCFLGGSMPRMNKASMTRDELINAYTWTNGLSVCYDGWRSDQPASRSLDEYYMATMNSGSRNWGDQSDRDLRKIGCEYRCYHHNSVDPDFVGRSAMIETDTLE